MIPFIDLKRNNNLDRFFFQNIKKFFNKKIFSGGEIIDKLENLKSEQDFPIKTDV